MRLNSAAFLLYMLPALCGAQSCVQKEYAQIKDEAKTPAGRTGLRFEYCLNKNTQRYVGNDPRGEICEAQNSKIAQVLKDAGDSEGMIFAMRDCKGPVPPPSK